MTMWFGLGWSVTLGSVVVLLGVIAWLRFRQQPHGYNTDENAAQAGFSLERYRPMERLLSAEDLRFLQSQPGFHPAMAARLKRERRRIVRLYLRDLKRDFRHLHAEARLFIAHGDAAAGELVPVLMRQQATFVRATVLLEIRLALSALGLGTPDVRPLLRLVDAARTGAAVPGREPQFG